ncbi:MAG: protein-L-isoaspartate(D-aspartate) O-methyltransferase [Ignavibacteriae bacterium]|nr:MAG: protein-L-isoaspartate(D-aspartate) O-methyltransferase [Ignavibacteriota bacterium]
MNRFEKERVEMAELLRQRGIRNESLLKAMMNVEREQFVLPAFMNRAYDDSALPIAHGQTISQPYTVAFQTEQLRVGKDSKILEIGTGSGYQAAVLAEMGCRVFTIERLMELHLEARKLLEKLGYHVAARCGDGTIGWKEYAPYDGIIVTAAAPDVPQPLLEQLADGGRLVIPVGNLDAQSIRVITRVGERFESQDAEGFKFVPLIGKEGWKQR